jgi:hypothetical protein
MKSIYTGHHSGGYIRTGITTSFLIIPLAIMTDGTEATSMLTRGFIINVRVS